MPTNIELYETLRRHMDEEVARVLAEALPPREDLATKSDIEHLELATRAEIKRLEASTYRWMLTFFATQWLGVIGIIVTILATA